MAGNNEIIEFGKEVKELNVLVKEQIELLKKVGDTIKTSYKALPSELLKQLKEQNSLEIQAEKLRQESIKSQQKLEELAKKQIQTARESQRLAEQNSKSEQRLANEREKRAKQEQKEVEQRAKQQEAENKRLEAHNKRLEEANRPYNKLKIARLEASRVLQDLLAKENLNSKAVARARQEYDRLDRQFRAINESMRNYQDNVGNYGSALNGIGGNIKGLIGAFGLVGGLTAGVSILKDAFQTVREFDAEMVNMGAIAGKTRTELGGLEKIIRDTAKTSLNTATDVAKVATELIKLGSSIEEAGKLIPTVNNLSIALRAGADETAELLKSSMNAFGASADEAERYGDVIAGMANKSALDFERIRDSMSYIAPVAKALGYTIEDTGALIGVLVDNGIKAESAGRLLRTGMVKLQAQGLTLNEALEKIKNSSDQTTTAMKLMGNDASTLAVVLANNIDKIKNLSEELRNTRGELEGLTQKQLKSLDAQIKITASNWKEFILSIENGEGELSKFATSFLTFINQAINGLTRLSLSWDELWNRSREQGEALGTKEAEKFLNFNKESESRINAIKKANDEIKKTEAEIVELRKKEKAITEGSFLNKLTSKGVYWYQKNIEEKENYIGQYKGYVKRLQDENAKEAIASSGFVTESVGGVKTEEDTTKLTKKQISDAKRLEEERLRNTAENRRLELQIEIDHSKNIGLINAKTESEKQAIQLKYNEDYKQILKLNYDEEVRQAQGNSEKLILAKTKYNAEIQKLEDDSFKITEEAREKQYQNALKLANMIEDNDSKNAMKTALMTAKSEQDKAQIRIKYIESQRQVLKRDQEQAIERVQKGSEEELIILEEYRQKRIDLDNEEKQILIDNAKKAQEQIKGYLSKFTDIGNFGFSSLNVFTTIEENGKSMFENMLKNAKDWKQQMALIIGLVGEVMKDVMGAMQDASRARYENELAQAQASYETSLLFAGDSAEAREKLEQELAEKQKAIRKKQAESDKKYAIMNAIINTAQAVTSVLATAPIWLKVPMSIAVGAMGAVQTALIASTPIPEFWTGTDNAPRGWAWTQERGAEVITDKDGNVKTYGNNKGAQLTFLESGDKVYKSQEDYVQRELNGILTSNNIGYGDIQVNNEFDYEEFERIASKNKSQTIVNFDENGVSVGITKRSNRQNIKNKYARR